MTSTPTRSLALFAVLIISLGGCTSQIEGDVFIVTQGGENVRLGLVEVHAIPEDRIVAHVRAKQERALAVKDSLQPFLERARETYEAAADVFDEKSEIEEEARSVYFESILSDRLRDAYYTARDTASVYRAEANRLRREVAGLQGEIDRHESAPYLFEGLPEAAETAKTDADGKFSLSLPSWGRYALAARGERRVGRRTETYHWLVWASPDDDESGRVFLSNDNLFESAPEEGVVQSVIPSDT